MKESGPASAPSFRGDPGVRAKKVLLGILQFLLPFFLLQCASLHQAPNGFHRQEFSLEGEWRILPLHPYYNSIPVLGTQGNGEALLRIVSDSFFLSETFHLDVHDPEDPCLTWPKQYFSKGKIEARARTLRFQGMFTDSTFQKTVTECYKDSVFGFGSTYVLTSDSLYFDAPRFYNPQSEAWPRAFVRVK